MLYLDVTRTRGGNERVCCASWRWAVVTAWARAQLELSLQAECACSAPCTELRILEAALRSSGRVQTRTKSSKPNTGASDSELHVRANDATWACARLCVKRMPGPLLAAAMRFTMFGHRLKTHKANIAAASHSSSLARMVLKVQCARAPTLPSSSRAATHQCRASRLQRRICAH